MKLLNLNKKYERSVSGHKFIIFSVLCGGFVALFLLVFQPFGLFTWQHPYKPFIIAGFGLVTTLTLLLTYAMVEVWWRKKSWTLGEQAISLFCRTFLIGIANGVYAVAVDMVAFTVSAMLWYLWVTFAVGIFPVLGLLLADYFKSLRERRGQASSQDKRVLRLISENQTEDIRLRANKLLYISSCDNYCEVVFYDDGIEKTLIRNTLKEINKQIKFPEIKRCHRSHIVNLSRVKKYEGNSQGLKLSFDVTNEEIPVSRKYVQTVRNQLKSNESI